MSTYAATYRAPEQPPQTKVYKAALYIRLSREDGDMEESLSVANQKELLYKYASQHEDIEIVDCFVDDGWSGANFERPGFMQMMSAIYARQVNCVIVKDGSRFGRNASQSSRYISEVFPRLKVRYIAVNDAIDSCKSQGIAVDFLNHSIRAMFNEFYLADCSQKIRSSLNVLKEKGCAVAAFAKYGYLKDPADRHKLVIDDEAADVVRLIFRLYLNGTGIRGIVRYLNDHHIPNPSTYKQQKGLNFRSRTIGGSPLWSDKTVRRTLKDEMYIGNMVQGKQRKVSYKDKAVISTDESEWSRVEGTHEAIVSREDFEKAQRMLRRGVKAVKNKGEMNLFAGLLYCADCGHALIKKVNRNPDKTYVYYRCSTHCKCKTACEAHTIRFDKLYDAVLISIQKMVDVAVNADEVLAEMKSRQTLDMKVSLRSQLESQERELVRIKELSAGLYPDLKSGLLNTEQYLINKEKFEEQQERIEESIASLKKSLDDSQSQNQNNAFIEHFKQHGNIDALNRPLLTELVDHILVSKDSSLDVAFNFSDAFVDAQAIIESKDPA